MKFKTFFAAVVAALALSVGCQTKEGPVEEPKLTVSPQTLSFESAAGEQTVEVTSTREWKAQIKYEGDAQDWLSVTPDAGQASSSAQSVTVTAKANTGTDRKATITFTIGLFKSSVAVSQKGEEGPKPVNDGSKEHPFLASEASAEAAKLASGEEAGPYYVKGFVKKFAAKHEDGITNYGNALFYITDDKSGEGDDFYCYQVYYLGGKKFTSIDQIKEGDEVIVYGKITNYNGTYETVGKGAAFIYSLNGKTEGGDDPDPVEPIYGENLLTNGSFETWTAAKPEAWDFTNGNATLTKVSDAKDGANACEVAGDANANKRLMSKEYVLNPGTYQIQAYVKGEGKYRMGYAKLTNHTVAQGDYNYLDSNPVQASSEWTLHYVQFKLEQKTSVSINVMNNSSGEGKSVIIDDVKLVTKDGGIGTEDPVDVVETTVSALLAAPSTDVIYKLTGTVSNFKSQYCSFDLTDATGKIYVYSVDSATKAEYASKLKDGDTVTIEGSYLYYESKQQHEIINAKITDWKQGGEPGPGPDPEVVETTVAALLANPSKDVVYKLSGTVSGVNAQYCSFDLTDATGKIYVYSVDAATKTEYASKLKDGDSVTIEGKYDYYESKQQHEIINAKITSWTKGEGGDEDYTKAEAKTVSEFLAAKDKATFYKLTGTVSNYGAANCRFDLTDATGTVYVYKVNNASDWSSKIHNGGTVTLAGKYDYYEAGKQDEVVDAYILNYDSSTETELKALEHPTTSSIKWTLGTNAYDATCTGNSKQSAIVNGKEVSDLLKLSTSSKPGSATLTIPAGVSKIGFYACGWLAADISVGSNTVSVKKNAGCTGNPQYTLELSDNSDYYEVAVSPGSVEISCPTRVLIIGINPVNN